MPLLHPNARTVAITRLLRAAAPAMHRRRGGRLPRQQQPDLIRLEYFKAIMPLVRAQTAHFAATRGPILRLLEEERQSRGDHMDASDREKRAKELIDRAAKAAENSFRPKEVFGVAEKFAKRTSEFQREQLDRQVRQAIGVPFTAIEKPARDLIPKFAAENVSLVQSIATRYHERLAKSVREAFESGEYPDTLVDRLSELDGIAENDARRIARDQIGKLNGDFNEERQTAMGVTKFVWRTMNDSRVRDSHADLEGETFEWEDPPSDDESGEDITPGSAILCRCYAEPDFEDILTNIQ